MSKLYDFMREKYHNYHFDIILHKIDINLSSNNAHPILISLRRGLNKT